MTFTKLTVAALVLGASFTPALAESGDTAQSPLSALEQSIAHPAHASIIEGRQAAVIATPAATNAVEAYLTSRDRDQDR